MYASKYFTCEQIDERLLQGYYDDAVAAGFEGTFQEFLESLNQALAFIQDPKASKIELTPISVLEATQVQAAIAELAIQIFPLTATFGMNNQTTYTETHEVSQEVTPIIGLNIYRKDINVAADSEVTVDHQDVSLNPSTKTITFTSGFTKASAGTEVVNIQVTETGQVVNLTANYKFSHYRYRGAVSSLPSAANLIDTIKQLATKEFSESPTLGETKLNGGMYYIFAVKGVYDLIIRNARTGGSIEYVERGKNLQIALENTPGITATYSYIIVPKSSNTWYFEIANS